MIKKPDDVAVNLLGVPYESLDELTKKVTRHIAGRKHIARNTAKEFDAKITLGQRAADAVATFGGSWTFIAIFAAILVVWVGLNSFINDATMSDDFRYRLEIVQSAAAMLSANSDIPSYVRYQSDGLGWAWDHLIVS